MSENFYISSNNPNNGIGGSGCVCSPQGDTDCTGPYAIFPAAEEVSNMSPHIVLSMACARKFTRDGQKKSNHLDAGEKG